MYVYMGAMVIVNVSLTESKIPWGMAFWACLRGIIFFKNYLCYFYSQVSWLEQLKDWPIWVSEEWRNDRHPYRDVGLDRLCTRIETHQQLPRNSARLLYAANEEEAGYLTSVGSIVAEQSQAVVSPEEEADMSEQLLQAPIPWLPCHDERDPGTACMTVYHILA